VKTEWPVASAERKAAPPPPPSDCLQRPPRAPPPPPRTSFHQWLRLNRLYYPRGDVLSADQFLSAPRERVESAVTSGCCPRV